MRRAERQALRRAFADEMDQVRAAYIERHRSAEPDGLSVIEGPADATTGLRTYVRGIAPKPDPYDGPFFDVREARSACAHEPPCRRAPMAPA